MTAIQQLYAAVRVRKHRRVAQQAIRIAEEHAGSAIGDYARSLAEQEARRVLRLSAATHIGRLARSL